MLKCLLNDYHNLQSSLSALHRCRGCGVGLQLDHLLEPVGDRAFKILAVLARSSVASLGSMSLALAGAAFLRLCTPGSLPFCLFVSDAFAAAESESDFLHMLVQCFSEAGYVDTLLAGLGLGCCTDTCVCY